VIAREVFDMGWAAVGMYLYHDIAEVFTGDIPATLKWEKPNIREIVNEAELEWQYRTGIHIPEAGMTDATATVFKIVDWSEAAHYCIEQLKMGNKTDQVAKTFYRLMYRCEDLAQELTGRGKPGQYSKRAENWINYLHIDWEMSGGRVIQERRLTND